MLVVPGTVVGIGNATMVKTDKISVFLGLSSRRLERPRETDRNPEKPQKETEREL